MPSQNVIFDGTAAPVDAPDVVEPKGAEILHSLRPSIEGDGWQVGEIDLFSGAWGVVARKGDDELLLMVTSTADAGGGDWFMQISWDTPGLVSRLLFGGKDKATPAACYAMAQVVHKSLEDNGFTNQRWKWDGPPSEGPSSETPEPPP